MDACATYLSVFENAVEIHPAGIDAKLIVQAGQQVSFTKTSVSEITPVQAASETWTRHVLLAEDMPLQDLVKEINRYHYGYISVASEVADLRVLGGYPLNDRDKIFAMLEEVLPIHVKYTLPWWISIEAKKKAS